MLDVLSFLTVLSLLGGGLVVGVQYSIASAILPATADLEPEQAMFAARQINDRFDEVQFVAVFIGTFLAMCATGAIALLALQSVERWWLVGGALLYVIGPFGITMLHSGPLNRQLKAADWSNADRAWPAFFRRAQFWSTLRSAMGVLALGALAVGAVEF